MATEPNRPKAFDVENPSSAAPGAASVGQQRQGCPLLLRALCCFFSLLSFAIMGSVLTGSWVGTVIFKEFSYLLAIGVFAFVYTLAQAVIGAIGLCIRKGKGLYSGRVCAILSFAGDQVFAYLLLSALSAAIPKVIEMTPLITVGDDEVGDGEDGVNPLKAFAAKSAASVSMAFFAFLALSLSALLSGYKVYTRT